MPDGQLRHFCEPPTATSISLASTSTAEPPSVTTASTMNSAPCAWASVPSGSSGCCTPVDVSPWTAISIRAGPLDSAARTASGSTAVPHSLRTHVTLAPCRSAISPHSRPKRPHSAMTTRSPGSVNDAMAASSPARPVPETGNVQVFCV